MALFLIGLVLFLGIHLSRVIAPGARDRLSGTLGANAYRGVYAVASILAFVLLIYGFGLARQETGILYE
eukprot:gene11924-15913_t